MDNREIMNNVPIELLPAARQFLMEILSSGQIVGDARRNIEMTIAYIEERLKQNSIDLNTRVSKNDMQKVAKYIGGIANVNPDHYYKEQDDDISFKIGCGAIILMLVWTTLQWLGGVITNLWHQGIIQIGLGIIGLGGLGLVVYKLYNGGWNNLKDKVQSFKRKWSKQDDEEDVMEMMKEIEYKVSAKEVTETLEPKAIVTVSGKDDEETKKAVREFTTMPITEDKSIELESAKDDLIERVIDKKDEKTEKKEGEIAEPIITKDEISKPQSIQEEKTFFAEEKSLNVTSIMDVYNALLKFETTGINTLDDWDLYNNVRLYLGEVIAETGDENYIKLRNIFDLHGKEISQELREKIQIIRKYQKLNLSNPAKTLKKVK